MRAIEMIAVAGAMMVSGTVSAELISIDFNTFALTGEKAEMQGADPIFDVGSVWNQVSLPRDNDGELNEENLVDSEGNSTPVGLHVNGPKIASWWSTDKLMPESRVYRDYTAFPKPADIILSGLKPDTVYHVAVLGYPLNWGRVELSLNRAELDVRSAPEWKDQQQPAGVMQVRSDGEGRLAGTVKGMLSGLHISTEPLTIRNSELVMIEGEAEKESAPLYPPTRSEVYKSIDGVDLYLDIYNPVGHRISDRRPAVVVFHGGSWSGGWKTHHANECHYLAQLGMVGITVEYRVTGRPPKSTPAECVRDAKSAMRWVRINAASLGIDPDRIVAGGGSAGGHLAAAVAYLDNYNEAGEDTSVSCRPQALFLINPVIDNSPGGGYPYGPQPIAETWPGWSPMHNITPEKAVPTIFFLGDQDHLIPVATGEEYKRITEAAGADCEYHVYPGVKHGIHNWGKELRQDMLEKTGSFLARHGFMNRAP